MGKNDRLGFVVPREGKERITVRQLLAHQAGLFAIDESVDRSIISDLEEMHSTPQFQLCQTPRLCTRSRHKRAPQIRNPKSQIGLLILVDCLDAITPPQHAQGSERVPTARLADRFQPEKRLSSIFVVEQPAVVRSAPLFYEP